MHTLPYKTESKFLIIINYKEPSESQVDVVFWAGKRAAPPECIINIGDVTCLAVSAYPDNFYITIGGDDPVREVFPILEAIQSTRAAAISWKCSH